MFLISELIRDLLYADCVTKAERPVETFGLAVSPVDKPFCTFIDKPEYLQELSENVAMILTTPEVAATIDRFDKFGVCIVAEPRLTYFKLHNALENDYRYVRERKPTVIAPTCKISPLAVIADHNVVIGENTVIEEFVVIRENTVIGSNCILRSGVKIGGTDFEFKREGDTIWGVNHYGGVRIGDHVEVQYNTGINRALYPWDDTVIGDYTKVDMLVHIAHGVKVGKACMIVANSGIGGRTVVGDNCWIGFASTIKNGITIGHDAHVNMGAVVTKSVGDGEAVSGNFAIDHKKFIEHIKRIARE